MNVLEKLLEEIKRSAIKVSTVKVPHIYLKAVGTKEIERIIRNHMNDGKDTNVPTNNGWIPVNERLPEDSEEIVLVQVSGKPADNIIFDDAFALATYASRGGWLLEDYPEWENPNVTVWRPLPEPYKPAEPKQQKNTQQKNTQQELEDFWRDK